MSFRAISLVQEDPYPIPLINSWQTLPCLHFIRDDSQRMKIKNGCLVARKSAEGMMTYNLSFKCEIDLIGKNLNSGEFTSLINLSFALPNSDRWNQIITSYLLDYEIQSNSEGKVVTAWNRSSWMNVSLSSNFNLEKRDIFSLLVSLKNGINYGENIPVHIKVGSLCLSGFYGNS